MFRFFAADRVNAYALTHGQVRETLEHWNIWAGKRGIASLQVFYLMF